MDTDISQSMASIAAATGRLLTVAGTLTDAEVAEPSLLPGWTRGHVLTHLARNADGLANLLRWAGTGIETPVYASAQARAADIAAGAGRPGRRRTRSPRGPHSCRTTRGPPTSGC